MEEDQEVTVEEEDSGPDVGEDAEEDVVVVVNMKEEEDRWVVVWRGEVGAEP
jgi:hypothetical protein